MSVGTWQDEFMPEGMCCDKPVEYSLRKWQGLTAENMAKHGVQRISHHRLEDVRGKDFGEHSFSYCALCDDAEDSCKNCRYVQFHGRACDEPMQRAGEEPSPWKIWVLKQDPQPMINALQQMKDAGYE